jgi:hypothetical protein
MQHQGNRRLVWLRLEQCRVTALGLALVMLPDWFGFVMPQPVQLVLLAGLLTSAAWLNLHARQLAASANSTHDSTALPI